MDKEIIVTITDREAYYLAQAVAWKRGTRKLFGITGLGDKIYDQLDKSITARRIAELNEDWANAKEKAPKDPEIPPSAKRTMCMKHRILLPCGLCGTQLRGKKFMKKVVTKPFYRP